ncbi:MAG: glycine cleavage system protein GcvH [Oscillospiraceae bacterium]|jgi:glycine cleavage system H protein|nr:glycine cleavage system protein GcvH [Oscillospiraceae bacterium]
MADVKAGLYYSSEHEWLRADDDAVYLGITDFAQSSLGDIVFVDGEPVGSQLSAGDVAGVIESVKAASDLYAPVSGVVLAINGRLAETPELLNEEPYACWIVKLTLSNPAELDGLMDAKAYAAFCEGL